MVSRIKDTFIQKLGGAKKVKPTYAEWLSPEDQAALGVMQTGKTATGTYKLTSMPTPVSLPSGWATTDGSTTAITPASSPGGGSTTTITPAPPPKAPKEPKEPKEPREDLGWQEAGTQAAVIANSVLAEVPLPAVEPWKTYTLGEWQAPEWWIGKSATTGSDWDTLGSVYNAMIPFLSPEDQRTAALALARDFPDVFGDYGNPDIVYNVPSEITAAMREQYTSRARAEQALAAVENMQSITGGEPGKGVTYLRQLLDVLRDYGGMPGEGQTRAQYLAQRAGITPLLDVAPKGYQSLLNMLATPSFSAGKLVPGSVVNGKYVFGQPNPEWY